MPYTTDSLTGATCNKCGYCCWDWKNNDKKNKCEHLGADMKTCKIYASLTDVGDIYHKSFCSSFPGQYRKALFDDLHPDCAYRQGWIDFNLVI